MLADTVPSKRYLRALLPISTDGEWLYRKAESLQLEGIVAKRNGSTYEEAESMTGSR